MCNGPALGPFFSRRRRQADSFNASRPMHMHCDAQYATTRPQADHADASIKCRRRGTATGEPWRATRHRLPMRAPQAAREHGQRRTHKQQARSAASASGRTALHKATTPTQTRVRMFAGRLLRHQPQHKGHRDNDKRKFQHSARNGWIHPSACDHHNDQRRCDSTHIARKSYPVDMKA